MYKLMSVKIEIIYFRRPLGILPLNKKSFQLYYLAPWLFPN